MTKALTKASPETTTTTDERPFVLIRTFSAGVHVGRLVRREGREVTLADARRIWRWRGANTLNELSARGCDEVFSRVSEPVDEITLTEAIEVLTCKPEAIENLSRSRWGK